MPQETRNVDVDEDYLYWPSAPPRGWRWDDLDRLLERMPDLPRRTELLDGMLIFPAPQTCGHCIATDLLSLGLSEHVPAELRVARAMNVVLDERNRPDPDVSVVERRVCTDLDRTWFPASAVRLVCEVMSEDSTERDRRWKPYLYARAGIPHFWRLEAAESEPVVYVYERDPATGEYALGGVHRDRLQVSVPFPVDIDLRQVHHM